MASMSNLDRLRATVIDGTTENVRYRQKEILKLYSTLHENANAILSSISQDTESVSPKIRFESESEYWLAINAVEQQYKALDFDASLKEEYSIARGVDNPKRRVGKGLVIIRPTTHTRFYSIISSLVTAIAAGNCVAIELANTTLNVDAILKDILPRSLDPETFCILNTTTWSSSSVFLVDQTSSSPVSVTNQLPSDPSQRAIAVVDRSADIDAASKAIVTARFSFRGTSPYSPDLILVNDFVKNEFMEACSRYGAKFLSMPSKKGRSQSNSSAETAKILKEAEEKGEVSISGSGGFKIVEIHDRNSPIVKAKISGYYLLIMESTSLVDSFNISNMSKSKSDFLALYAFADSAAAKFLCQQFNTLVSYANHIPSHLLVGPAAPSTPIFIPAFHKYSTDMFSSSRPQYSPPGTAKNELASLDNILLSFDDPKGQGLALEKLQSKKGWKEGKLLGPKQLQPKGSQIGFFEQGVLIGGSLFLTAVFSVVGAAGFWIFRRRL